MRVCPNQGLKSWQDLEKSVGKFRAYRLFISNNYEIPEVDSIEVNKEVEDKRLVDIKDRLERVIGILDRNSRDETSKGAIEKLKELNQRLAGLEELQGIQAYIVSASEIAQEYRKKMDEILQSNDLSKVDDLAFINRFLGTFSNMTSLQDSMFRSEIPAEKKAIREWKNQRELAKNEGREGQFLEENVKPINTTKTVDKTVKLLEGIKKDYLSKGIDLEAQKLWSYRDKDAIRRVAELKAKRLKENPNDAEALAMVTTWQELAEQMKQASTDIGFYERWLTSALGGSSNSVLSLMTKVIKEKQSEAQDKLREYKEILGKATDEYKQATGETGNNPKAMYEKFTERVTIPQGEGKEPIEVLEWISEFNQEKFSNDKHQFEHENKELKEKNWKAYNRKYDEWIYKHTQPKANAEDIITSKKESLSEWAFGEWSKKNYYDSPSGKRTYKGELVEPGKYYRDESKLSKLNEHELKYYKVLKSVSDRLNLLLPEEIRKELGNRIPTIQKSDWEYAAEGKVKTAFKNNFKQKVGDVNYANVDLNGRALRELPFYFTGIMEAEDTSLDLLGSLLQAAKHWNISHTKMSIMSDIQILQDIGDNLAVVKTNANGEGVVDIQSTLNNFITSKDGKYLKERWDEIIKDLAYGMEEEDSIFNSPFGKLSANKSVQTVLKTTSTVQLAGSLISGSVNLIMGKLNNLIESVAGEFINLADSAKAETTYWKYLPNLLADRHKLHDEHWFTRMTEDFDLLHGEYINSFGHNVSGSTAMKEAKTNHLMFLNSGAEHYIGITSGLKFLNSVKWIDGKFIQRYEYRESGGDMKIFEKAKSLLDAMEETEGRLDGEYKGAWSFKQRESLKNRVHEVNKYVHGNYAKEDRTGLQRRWYGKLAIMFRKYVVPGFARRYGKERFNEATGTVMEGFYRSSAKVMYNFIKGILADMKEVGLREALSNNKLNDLQKANLRRLFGEGASFILMICLVGALTPDDDEEKNTYWENMSLLIARRMQSELSFYVDIRETWRIIKTPAVSMSMISDFADFASGLLFKYGEDEEYKRDTGIWDKGDSKDVARLVKLIPVLKGVLAATAPEEQLKVFNR